MKKSILALSFIFAVLFSCKKPDATPTVPASSVTTQDVVNQYTEVAYQQHNNALTQAYAMEAAIEYFTIYPTEANFDQAKEAWKTARRAYSLLEGYRFYGGPIDNSATDFEAKLNAWPMDESGVDYVDGNANTGIINNLAAFPTITSAIITENDGKDGETNVTTGFHVIEFLLWGQDLSSASAGQRPYTDYVPSTVSGAGKNADRRSQYLHIAAELILDHLLAVTNQWKVEDNENYRAQFTKAANVDASMAKILKGIGTFSKAEFGGERLTTAYETKDEEDEHDCFSDFTTAEIPIWQQSITNIYYGKYKKMDGTLVDGAGIDDLIKVKDAALATATDKLITDSYTASLAVPDPFDNAIAAGDTKIKTVIDAVQDQGDRFVEIATKLGYNIVLE